MEGNTHLRVDVEDFAGVKKYAIYDVFKVAGASDKYRLTIDGYSGTAGEKINHVVCTYIFRKF